MILRFAALLLLVLALVVVIDSFRTRGVTLQYLYFVRFPLLFAIALLVLPSLTGWYAPQLMKNVFILSHTWEFAVIVTLAIIAGWVVMYTLLLILNSLDE